MDKARAHIKRLARILPFVGLAAFALAAGAAPSYQVNNGATVQVNEHGVCQDVYNATGLGVFVPTNSGDEWSYFRTYKPGSVSLGPCYSYSWQVGGWGGCSVSCGTGTQSRSVWCQRSDGATVDNAYCGGGMPASSQACDMGSCCAPNYGQGCVGETNNCGNAYSGTYMCNGLCSAQSAPPDVPDRWVCSGEFCVNSEEVCDFGGYNCSYECTDWEQNCGWESG